MFQIFFFNNPLYMNDLDLTNPVNLAGFCSEL